MQILDGARRQASVQFRPVEALKAGRIKCLMFLATQSWRDVLADEPFVAVEGLNLHAAFDRIIEPPVQTLADSQIPGVKN